jgi:hypothetical protein
MQASGADKLLRDLRMPDLRLPDLRLPDLFSFQEEARVSGHFVM